MKFPKRIKLAVLHVPYVTELNETNEGNVYFTGGIDSELLKILSHELEFEFELLIPHDRQWGKLEEDGQEL